MYYCILISFMYSTLGAVMRNLQHQVKRDVEPFPMIVRRAHVLEDALRRIRRISFDPSVPITVCAFMFHAFTHIAICIHDCIII